MSGISELAFVRTDQQRPITESIGSSPSARVVVGAIAIASMPTDAQPAVDAVTSPLRGLLVALGEVCRVGVLVTLAGAVLYLVRLFPSLRPTRSHDS